MDSCVTGAGPKRPIDQWAHRQAIQIVAQLPDDAAEALAILERAKELLICWNGRDSERPTRPVLIKA